MLKISLLEKEVNSIKGWVMRIRAIILASIFCLGGGNQARSQAVSSDTYYLLLPAIAVIVPIIKLHDMVYGSASEATKSANKAASKILENIKQPIPVRGIYTGSLNLEEALQGILIQSQLPFVEVDVAGSNWLLSKAQSPQDLINKFENQKYIRLALGTKEHADCLIWKNEREDFTRGVPIRPGACLLVSFTNELQSDFQLRIDSSRVSKWELKWELLDRATEKVVLAVPFWQGNPEDKTLVVRPVYQNRNAPDTFGQIVKKLSASTDVRRSDNLPFQLNWIQEWPQPAGISTQRPLDVVGQFRPITLAWSSIPLLDRHESWDEGYARAVATGNPIMMNKTRLITPASDTVAPACASPNRVYCGDDKNYMSEVGVVSLHPNSAYRSDLMPNQPHEMSMIVSIRAFSGELRHFVKITPYSLPSAISICQDWSLGCSFYPKQATITATDLVIRGAFYVSGNPAPELPKDEYELFIPLKDLPPPLTVPITGH